MLTVNVNVRTMGNNPQLTFLTRLTIIKKMELEKETLPPQDKIAS